MMMVMMLTMMMTIQIVTIMRIHLYIRKCSPIFVYRVFISFWNFYSEKISWPHRVGRNKSRTYKWSIYDPCNVHWTNGKKKQKTENVTCAHQKSKQTAFLPMRFVESVVDMLHISYWMNENGNKIQVWFIIRFT